jgi:hypothetical protein
MPALENKKKIFTWLGKTTSKAGGNQMLNNEVEIK